MIISKITYFEQSGNSNIDDVIKISLKAAKELKIKKIVVFSARMASVLKVKNTFSDDFDLIIATYSSGRKFLISKDDESEEEIVIPEVATQTAKNIILNQGMKYVQGGLPFEPILSCTGDNSTEMIVSTFELISNGLTLCINGAIMAYENGYVKEGEQIISFCGDTSIVVCPTAKRDLFNGNFKIQRILCKPI
jgi:hypothetical protein